MAQAMDSVILDIKANIDQAQSKLKELNQSVDGLEKQTEKSTGGMGGGFSMLALKIAAVVASLKAVYDATTKQISAELRLQKAIENNVEGMDRQGKTVNQLMASYKQWAAARQQATGIGDEETLQLMQQLTVMGVMPNKIQRVTSVLQDMEASTGASAETFARLYSRMQAEPDKAASALTRYGIKLDESLMKTMTTAQQQEYVLAELERRFKGMAEETNKATFGIKGAQAAIGDTLEEIGKVIFPILVPVINMVKDIFTWFNNLPGPIKGVTVALGGLAAAFMANPILGAAAAILGLVSALQPAKADLKEVKGAVDDLSSAFLKQQESEMALEEVRKGIKGLEVGSKEYEAAMKDLIASNKILQEQNIKTSDTYGEVEARLKAANAQLTVDAINKASEAYDKGLNKLKEYAFEIAMLEEQQRRNGYLTAEQSKRLDALNNSYGQLATEVAKAGQLVGKENDVIRRDLGGTTIAMSNLFGNVTLQAQAAADAVKRIAAEMNFMTQTARNFFAQFNQITGRFAGARRAFSGGGGGGGSANRLNYEKELAKLQIELMRDQAKEELKIRTDMEQHIKKIRESYGVTSAQREKLIAMEREVAEKKIAEVRDKYQAHAFKKTEELVKGVIAGIKMDMQGVASAIGSLAGGPFGQFMTSAQSVFSAIFDLFKSDAEEAAKEFADQIKAYLGDIGLVDLIVGKEDTEEGLTEKIAIRKSAQANIAKQLGMDWLDPDKAREIIKLYIESGHRLQVAGRWMTKEMLDGLQKYVALSDDIMDLEQDKLDLEEAKLDLLEEQTSELEKQMDIGKNMLGIDERFLQGDAGAALQQLLAQYQQLMHDIEVGKVTQAEGFYRQQALLQAIQANLFGQGATAFDVQGVEGAMAESVSKNLGENVFNAMSGQGFVPGIPDFMQPAASNVTNSSQSTVNNSFMVNGQEVSLSPDLWQAILSQINTQTGQALIPGVV